MPLSRTRSDQLQRDIKLILASTHINDWERSFLRDMQAKLNRYGPGMRFSDKQYRRLMALTTGIEAPPLKAQGYKHRTNSAAPVAGQDRRRTRGRRKGTWVQLIMPTLFLLTLSAFLFYKAVERFPEKLARLVSLTSTAQVTGTVTRVRDGDTIEVAGVPVRFGSLDCAERGTSSGRLAARMMRELISGETLRCFLNGRVSYDRKIGSCRMSDGRDLASVMIKEGYCRRFW